MAAHERKVCIQKPWFPAQRVRSKGALLGPRASCRSLRADAYAEHTKYLREDGVPASSGTAASYAHRVSIEADEAKRAPAIQAA
jgi:hypothetical protein